MNILELSTQRQSCRNYLPQTVEQSKIDYIMECVRLAPSAVNRQPWHFYIAQSDDARAKLQRCYNREWFATAPVYVIATILHSEEWVRSDDKHHGDIDIAIAVEHLCLAATEQGLGTCWVCNFDASLCHDLFNLPAEEEAAVLIPIGYPADPYREKKRKDMTEILTVI